MTHSTSRARMACDKGCGNANVCMRMNTKGLLMTCLIMPAYNHVDALMFLY